MIEVLEICDLDVKDVAELSFEVGKLHDEALPKYFNKTNKKEHLRIIECMRKDENAKILVAKDGEKVVGFICLGVAEDKRKGYKVKKLGEVYNLGVEESYRKKGVGKLLMEKGEEYFEEKGCEAIDLNVFWFNQNALAFLESLGFEKIDVNLRKEI